MSDLIQRLRAWPMDRETANEAAAEIERLQKDIAPVPRSEVIDRLRTRAESAERQRDEATKRADEAIAALREWMRVTDERRKLDAIEPQKWTRENSRALHFSTAAIRAAEESARRLLNQKEGT